MRENPFSSDMKCKQGKQLFKQGFISQLPSFPECFTPFTGGTESPDFSLLLPQSQFVSQSMHLTPLMKNACHGKCTNMKTEPNSSQITQIKHLASWVCGLIMSWTNKPVFFMGFITSTRKRIQNYANVSVMSNYCYILVSCRMTQYDDQIEVAIETE